VATSRKIAVLNVRICDSNPPKKTGAHSAGWHEIRSSQLKCVVATASPNGSCLLLICKMYVRILRKRAHLTLRARYAAVRQLRTFCKNTPNTKRETSPFPSLKRKKSSQPMSHLTEAQTVVHIRKSLVSANSLAFTFSSVRSEPVAKTSVKVTRSASGKAAFFEIATGISSATLAETLKSCGVKGIGIKQGSCAILGYEFPPQSRRNRESDRIILPLQGTTAYVHQGGVAYQIDLALKTIDDKPFLGTLIIARESNSMLHITISGKLLRDFSLASN
jgi:hypothetical protein